MTVHGLGRDPGGRSAEYARRTLLGGGAAYGALSLWENFDAGRGLPFTLATLVLLGFVLALFGASLLHDTRIARSIVPPAAAVFFACHIVYAVAVFGTASELRFALLFALLGLYLALIAPAARDAFAALAVAAAVALAAALFYLPVHAAPFRAVAALAALAPFLAATALEIARRAGAERTSLALRKELERRATSDDLTGVSNRAHIQLLAQNEFARARRYRENFSCLVLEIDDGERLRQNTEVFARITQVFTGYCVVVMRHCDSFGRLGLWRFLALLPETGGEGALTLAKRMCRDLAGLSVAVSGASVTFTVSIGAAELHKGDKGANDLLRRAEQALDDAVEQGRNGAILAAPPFIGEADFAPDKSGDAQPAVGSANAP